MNGHGPQRSAARGPAPARDQRSRCTGAGSQPPAMRSTSQALADGARRLTYMVRRGDTLYGIARLLQVTVR